MKFSPRLIAWAQGRSWIGLLAGWALFYMAVRWLIYLAVGTTESLLAAFLSWLPFLLGAYVLGRLVSIADAYQRVDRTFNVNVLNDPAGARQDIERQLYHDARKVRQRHDLCAGGKQFAGEFKMYEMFYKKDAELAHKVLGLPERRWDEIHPPFSTTACC